MRRPIISLGDVLRVCAQLQPADEEARQAVRELLGVEADAETSAPATLGAWMPSSSHNVMTIQRKATMDKERFDVAPRATSTATASRPSPPSSSTTWLGGRSTLTRLSQGAPQPSVPAWFAYVPALERVEESGVNPPPQPLFDRTRRRAILSSALATHVDEGELDLLGIVATVSAGQPLPRVPRLPLPTLRRGVQVLLDVGQGMDPFAEDQRDLVQALDDVLADDRVEVLQFDGCPTRGVRGESESRYRAWRPPPQGVPLFVVTDLGIGGPMLDRERPRTAEWLAFARRVRQAGHVLVAVVPYEATRWQRRLRRVMALIHWSERTTVGAVRHALRDARRRFER